MSIRRRKKTKAFTQIDNAALRNPALSLKAKGLLAVMMSCPEDWQFYMDWLQRQSSDGRESHQTAMKELERHGYVVREKVQGKGGKFSGWGYLVDDEPYTPAAGAEEPTNGKAVSRLPTDERENRQTGKPSDGKTATTNTEVTNTDLKKSGVFNVEDNARTREAPPSALPVGEDSSPYTTGKASLQKDAGDEPFTAALGSLSTPVAPSPGVAVHEPPAGGAADAADEGGMISEEDFEMLFGGQDTHATDPKDVPGGGAAAPRGTLAAPTALRVADLAPMPRDELLSRPVARADSPQGRMIQALVTGKRFPELLEQPTPTGALSREDWLRLTLVELEQVKLAARTEAREQGGNMITLSIAGLDRMIGAVPRAKSERVEPGGADPAQVAKHDPCLAQGQRCEVAGELGVVFAVTHAHYLVNLDREERVSVNRALKAELLRLKASDAELPGACEAEINRHAVGAQWRDRKSGTAVVITGTVEVRNRAGMGLQYTLSDGRQLSALDLMLGYEFVGAGAER